MKKIIFLLLFLSTFSSAQIWTDTIPDWDHDNIANIKIQYSRDWVHMDHGGSYPKNNDAMAVYQFWGQGIDVYTELMHHHEAYIVNIDGVDIDTVNVKDDRNLVDKLTFSARDLSYDNHILELRRYQGYFVINKLIKFVDCNPYPPAGEEGPPKPELPIPPDLPCIPDTVFVPKPYPVYDTIYLHPKYFFLPDSIAFEIK